MTAQDPKESGNVFCLLYDGNKYIWAATASSGLLKINTQTQRVEESYGKETGDNQPLPGPTIYAVTKSSFNQLMMATTGGITVMDIARKSFRLLNITDGLPDNNVSALLKDKHNNIWFAGDNGISAMKQAGYTTSSYGLMEGLSTESFNVGAAVQLRDGRMLFGHNEGFTSFNPAGFEQPEVPSAVTVTSIRLFDKSLNTDSILNNGKGMVLKFSQNFLTIEFSNMSLLNKNNAVYYYQLEGVDKDWIQCKGLPQAIYTYLPGGNYTFRVKCSTGNGTGLQKITSFNIKIIPPLWKAWWFYVIAAVFAGGLVYLFLRTRYKHQLATEKGRSRIAKDLHDDMGSTISTINILSEMAKTKIDTDIPTAKKFIQQISENSNRVMESLDDIVWNIDTANHSMENTLSRMREFAGHLLEARDIRYTFKADERIKDIHLELGRRHDFFMIFKEAVNNLAKYSGCATANIDVSLQKNSLYLLITDDGKGFDRNIQFEGNGLTNMQERAAALPGALQIESEINKGTTITLTIPL
jgi:two-component sensor histidine kinase